MPAFNSEKTVRQAAMTTLRAMPQDSQLIVFDDCSTDQTLAVLETIRDPRLRLIRSADNVGGGAARNKMIELSDSEYLAAMDADDVTLPWRFRLQLRALETADVAFSSAVRFGDRVGLSAPTSLTVDELPPALLFHCPVFHPSLTARRSAFERVGNYISDRRVSGDLKVDDAEDYELWLRMALSGVRMRRLGTPVLAYRLSSSQVTAGEALAAVKRTPNRRLQEAYLDLCSFVLDIPPLAADCEAIIETLEGHLHESLVRFRLLNRAHFAKLLASRPQTLSPRVFFRPPAVPS
ncbi:MAG: glycosyltransferase [Mycobacterium sp.]|nr:glycosyltransferase [Mycobacterium sp.]